MNTLGVIFGFAAVAVLCGFPAVLIWFETPHEDRAKADASRLDRLIADPAADIREVVDEVERLCEHETRAAEYYKENVK